VSCVISLQVTFASIHLNVPQVPCRHKVDDVKNETHHCFALLTHSPSLDPSPPHPPPLPRRLATCADEDKALEWYEAALKASSRCN